MLTTIIIIILYPLITLGLVSLPFFLIKKRFKPLKWRHIFLGYFLGGIILIAWVKIVSWFNRWIYYNAYDKLHWILEPLLHGITLLFFLSPFLISLSLPLVVKMKYGEWNDRRIYYTIIATVFLIAFLILAWSFIIAWGLGQIGMKYF